MLRIVALLCGLAMLSPLALLLWMATGQGVPRLLAPIAYIAASVPVLAFVTLGGVIVTMWAAIKLVNGDEREYGPDGAD